MNDRQDQPTATDLRASLEEIVGAQEAKSAIARGMRELDTTAALDELTPVQLLDLALALARQRGLVAVIGRSFAIRMRAFLQLENTGDGQP
jgi:hypothetical protein